MMAPGETHEQQIARKAAYEKKYGAINAEFGAKFDAEIKARIAASQELSALVADAKQVAPLDFMGLADELSRSDRVTRKNGVIIDDAC